MSPPCLAGGERVGQRLPALVGQRDVGLGELADGGDVGEIVDAEGELGRVRVERHGGGGVGDEAVAVGRRLHQRGGGHRPAGAGLVLDDHLLAELPAQHLADHARGDVGGAAGAEADRDGDRLVGPGRAGRRRRGPAGEHRRQHASPHRTHARLRCSPRRAQLPTPQPRRQTLRANHSARAAGCQSASRRSCQSGPAGSRPTQVTKSILGAIADATRKPSRSARSSATRRARRARSARGLRRRGERGADAWLIFNGNAASALHRCRVGLQARRTMRPTRPCRSFPGPPSLRAPRLAAPGPHHRKARPTAPLVEPEWAALSPTARPRGLRRPGLAATPTGDVAISSQHVALRARPIRPNLRLSKDAAYAASAIVLLRERGQMRRYPAGALPAHSKRSQSHEQRTRTAQPR